MTIQIQRPKDLPAATALADSDILAIDQGANGVKAAPLAQFAGFFTAGTFQALAAGGTTEPEGAVVSSPPGMYFLQQTDTANPPNITRWELWIKASGIATATGWVLAIKFV